MRYLGVLFLVLAFTASAQAEKSVDWSAYIESGPSRPLVRTQGPSSAETAAKSSRPRIANVGKTKASKAKAKKSKSKVKARSKKKARRK
jgi:hypothetical protein